jgi:hypothetical protein
LALFNNGDIWRTMTATTDHFVTPADLTVARHTNKDDDSDYLVFTFAGSDGIHRVHMDDFTAMALITALAVRIEQAEANPDSPSTPAVASALSTRAHAAGANHPLRN